MSDPTGKEAGSDMSSGTVVVVTCPACGEVAGPGARFCEGCGAGLASASRPDDGVAHPGGPHPGVTSRPGEESALTPPGTVADDDAPERVVPGHGDTDALDHEPVDHEPVHPGTGPASGTVLDPDPDSGAAAPVRPCAACGGRVAADGYCEACGAPAQSERDHFEEQPAPWVGGVCDRGIRHVRNEDAMALAAGPAPGTSRDRFAALVVCDGVSSAPDSDLASLAASRAARDVLESYGPGGAAGPAAPSPRGARARATVSRPITGRTSARIAGWTDALVASSRAANAAVVAAAEQIAAGRSPDAPVPDPPSCTFATAVVDGDLVVAGWIGDSRVYWLPDSGKAEQLSVDDSWAQEMIAAGIPRVQAENAPQAHAITRWLGPDAPDADARCAATVARGPGWLLVCSDGLWNYCSAPRDMLDLVRRVERDHEGEPLAMSGALVRWANEQGGRDNITAALARLVPARHAERSSARPAPAAP